LTPCYGEGPDSPGTANYTFHAAYEILDPTKNFTYDFMREFFTEIKRISKDEYVHLGMDEVSKKNPYNNGHLMLLLLVSDLLMSISTAFKVYYACWQSSPEITNFMNEMNFTNYSEVQAYYTERHLNMIKNLGFKSIIWHDPIEFGVQVRISRICHNQILDTKSYKMHSYLLAGKRCPYSSLEGW
jgi:hexosaminidase